MLKLIPYLLLFGLLPASLDLSDRYVGSNVTLLGQLTVLYWIVSVVLTIMVANLAAQVVRGERPNLRRAFAMKRFGALFGTNLLANLLILVGCLLLVVPGLMMAARYALSTPVVLFEGRSGVDALRRSSELSAGHRMKLFALVVTLFMVPIALRLSADSLAVAGIPLSYLASCLELSATGLLVFVYFGLATPCEPEEAVGLTPSP